MYTTNMKKRSPTLCPIVFSLDVFGDTWSLLILRDILFDGKRHFREFLASPEKIASNILSNRLEQFIENGLVTKHDDPKNKSAAIYLPTQKALDLVPMLIEMMKWGIAHNPDVDKNAPFMQQVLTDPEGLQKSTLKRFRAES
jgi:DNA-binding HxlR family transcriptional regulator